MEKGSALPPLKSFVFTMLGSFPPLGFGSLPGHSFEASVGSVITTVVNFEK